MSDNFSIGNVLEDRKYPALALAKFVLAARYRFLDSSEAKERAQKAEEAALSALPTRQENF